MTMSDKDVKDYHKMVDTLTKQAKAIKLNGKYNYMTGKQITDPDTGKRVYEISSYRLPSVTTILGATKNTEFLTKWKAKVGEAEADRIKNVSSARGTSMHKFLESYVTGVGYDDLTELGCQARPMAKKIVEVGLAPVEEYYGSEVTLHYPGLYAGQTDLICNHNGMETVVDFKQANRPKKKEWIEDYYLQIAAYAMAHDYVYGSEIKQGVIMVCTPDLYYQEFKVEGPELRRWKHAFLKRLDMYHDLMFDEKEKTTPMKAEDFNDGSNEVGNPRSTDQE